MSMKRKSPDSFIWQALRKSSYGVIASSLALSVGCSQQKPNEQKQESGVIGTTLKDSKPFDPEKEKTATKSPNVVWVVIDDVGFGATSAFGGLIQTPTLDKLANDGLRYSNFHVQAYCAPTRAALLTGRNHHSAHVGLFPETAINYLGYDARIPFEKATAAEILRENGYNTFAVGKWHVTPVKDVTQAGPFDRWPTGRGFDHFYGFLYAETDQYRPQLFENNSKVESTEKGKELSELLADKAIKYIANQKSAAPEKPFFLYFATGATHEPHQVAQEWRDKYKGKFDAGWDNYREVTLANQKKLGLVPQDAVLPHNAEDRAWSSLSADEKKLYARYFENYAGFLSYTDYQIGRVVDYIKEIGQLDNTVIVVLVGDNGASGEGTENGYTQNWNNSINDKPTVAEALKSIDKIGTDASKPHQPRTWATATNTPFRLWKGNAQAEGGTHVPLIVYYPKGIQEKGGVRNQYTHVIDVLPTTLELVGAKVPETINGYKQAPIEGTSFFYTLNDAQAKSKHTLQYYETAGRRAIYKDGWKAGANHIDGNDFNNDVWELYHIDEDFNELNNLANKNPEKLKELKAVFDEEARKYNVYPLKDWKDSPWGTSQSRYGNATQVVLYPGVDQLFGESLPPIANRSYSVTATANIESAKTEGVLFAYGGSFGGISLFIKDGKFQVAHNNSPKLVHLESSKPVPTGKVKLRFEQIYKDVPNGDDIAGSEAIFINDEKVGELPIKKYQANVDIYDEGLDVGRDLNYPVSDRYQVPFQFTGKIDNVTINYK